MNNYINQAMRTNNTNCEEIRKRLSSDDVILLLHGALLLSTESGELLNALKSFLIYGKELDFINIKEELGDICWGMALICDTLDCSFEDVMKKNISKLKARYPHKFTQEDALNRDLKKERDTLEEI